MHTTGNVNTHGRKGIILAGGHGTRLWPMTAAVSKQLLPIWDKPMIFYPLSTLMTAGIQDVLLISTPRDLPHFQRLLGDGHQFGISLSYALQERPEGLAQAMLIGAPFLDNRPSALVLGDNIFHGHEVSLAVRRASHAADSSIIASPVADPERYGVVVLDPDGRPISIEEKPEMPQSNLAVTGLYFYDSSAPELAKSLKPSPRGELEITDLNVVYLDQKRLNVETLPADALWLDTGTNASFLQANQLVEAIQTRLGALVGSPEIIALENGWIESTQIETSIQGYAGSGYAQLLAKYIKAM